MSRDVIDQLYAEFLTTPIGKEILQDANAQIRAMNELAQFIRQRVDDREVWLGRDKFDDGAILYSTKPAENEDELFCGDVVGCTSQTLGLQRGQKARVLIVRE